MTFLHSFSDSTAFILSVDIHHFSDMIFRASSATNTTILPASCPNRSYWKMQLRFFVFFFFPFFFSSLIHSYTYVVPISPVPKYSGGLSLRKKNSLGVFLKVLLCFARAAGCRACPLVHRVSVRGGGGSHWSAGTQAASSQSLCVSLPDGPLC